MKTEKINGIKVFHYGDNAETETLSCLDANEIQSKIDKILNERSDWTVSEIRFVYEDGVLKGTVLFSIPHNKKKVKRFEVSWREHSICYATVEAPNKRAARKIAEENFPDDREYEKSTDWKVKEIK